MSEPSITSHAPDRADDLRSRLDGLVDRVNTATANAGRAPGSVKLLPVTKFFPASDVEILYDLGRREFGESREQEASGKVAELTASGRDGIEWHMIGRLQRNKARSVAKWAHTVHSVDSERLANALDRGASEARAVGERTAPLRVLLQVSLDADPTRGGVAPDEMLALADLVEKVESLTLAGLMAIPPLDTTPEAAFAKLAKLHASLLSQHADATELSAGMSGDLEIAVAHGSTCVRVGTALMGGRPITSP
ncbi:YggS family pyridoxal phosphate-dependent enzyme [Nocardia camponoti]|uniref:Pyridoxal phosphate homeostasis protein n=1 Tax=Nocardia camponoti TaxID=1616106 RepID=A0A917VDV9_9NOCA|nr:YggS family pyridoxal phosphate-dependent enzyme [Nocardia camponoti]GGK65979.1 hypothetical protein GCM10011591_42650 [Nocardia camponoti]